MSLNWARNSSSWWIVSAYNSQFGGAPTGADGSTAGLTRGLATAFTGYDFVELFSVSGSAVYAGAVPEPATLALVGIALAVISLARRPRSTRQP